MTKTEPSDHPPLAGTVVRGSSLAAVGWTLGQILNFASYVVLAHLASPEDFGQLAAGTIIVGFGELFAGSGMLAALIHRRDRIEEAANTALVATLAAGLGLSLVALALAPLVGLYFDSEQITEIAAAVSVWVLLRSATTVPDALMQRRFSFVRRMVIEPLGIIVFGATSIVLVANGLGVWGLVLGNTAQRLVMVLAAWALVRWRPNIRLASVGMWREMIGFGRHVVVAELVRTTSSQVNTALLGRFVGTTALGQYTYAARIAQKPLGFVVNAGSYVLYPAFARIAANERRFRSAFLRSLRMISALAIPIGFVMLPLGEPFAAVVFGEPWRDAGYAAMAMFAYVGGRSITSLAGEAFKAAGRPDILPRLSLVTAVLSVGFIVALLPLGLVGVATAISVSSIGVAAYAIRSVAGVLGLSVPRAVREILPALAASSFMAGVLLPVEHLVVDAAGRETALGLLLLVAELGAAVGLYLGALAALAPPVARELLGVIRQVPRGLRRRSRAPESAAEQEASASPNPVI
jgi:O-antigen/teichoic acid export membrane protein